MDRTLKRGRCKRKADSFGRSGPDRTNAASPPIAESTSIRIFSSRRANAGARTSFAVDSVRATLRVAWAVTFFSSYPNSDRYYRLRAYQGRPFELAPHGRSFSRDDSVTSVDLVSNVWYRFHIDVHAGSDRTEILARVWRDGTSEPSRWQIECLDTAPDRFTFGTIGLWSMGGGKKEWSQLTVNGARVSLANDSLDDAAEADPVQETGESVTLGWDAPTTDANGQSLRDLAGYRVFWSKDRHNLSRSRTVGTHPRVTLSGLDRAVYYVAVTALDASGNESPRTGILTVDLR